MIKLFDNCILSELYQTKYGTAFRNTEDPFDQFIFSQIQKRNFDINCQLNKLFAFDLVQSPNHHKTLVYNGLDHYYIKFYWPKHLTILDYMHQKKISALEEIEVVYFLKQFALTIVNLSKYFTTKTILKFLTIDNVLVTDQLYYDFSELFVQKNNFANKSSLIYLAMEILQ